ncbi:MAG: tetratricopeptide repeat protein [Planctomycetes bacterium]|nr:tetratricopeptide repeat protein [Planctomycetota bacterium]
MSDANQPPKPETLLDIAAPGSSDGGTLLSLEGPGNESVLSRVNRLSGSGTPPAVELRTTLAETRPRTTQPESSRDSGRRPGVDFTARVQEGGAAAVRYVAENELGRGGMGVVLRVRDNDLRRDVAMKVVRADRYKAGTDAGAATLRRFVEEAQITGQLEHPNIVPVHELGADVQGRVFFTMKMVKGRSLADVIKALRAGDAEAAAEFPMDRLLQVFMKVCDALSFAHAHNVVHRDLKPENIMLGRFGEVLVMDWGLARILDQPTREEAAAPGAIETDSRVRRESDSGSRPSALSMEGVVAGTPAYMAPEQARGEISRIDQTTDVFALGAILYELLVLRPPYAATGGTQILELAVHAEIQPPAQRLAADPELRARLARLPGGRLPPELAAIAMHALEKFQSRRYPTARALNEDIENYLAGRSVSVYRDPLPVRVSKWVRRHPTLSVSTAASALVLLVAVASVMGIVAEARKDVLVESERTLAASRKAESEATARAEAESQTLARERELLAVEKRRKDELERRAVAEESFRLGAAQAERARAITDATLRDSARKEAEKSFEQAIAGDQAYVEPVFALARLHEFFADPRAMDRYRQTDQLMRANTGRGDARALVYAGDFARLVLGDVEKARACYEQAAKVDPADPLAMVGQGYVEVLDGDFGKAIEQSRKARAADDKLWEPFLLEGSVRACFFKRGDRELNPHFDCALADDLLCQGLRRNIREGVLFNERGTARLELGRVEEAEADFRRALELMPGRYEPLVNLALALRKQYRLHDALEASSLVLEKHAAMHTAWMEHGNVLLALGQTEEAIAAFRKSLELRPGRPAPHNNLAVAYFMLGRLDDAELEARESLKAEPEFLPSLLLLSELAERRRKFDEALAAVDGVLALKPDYPYAFAQKARVLVQLTRYAEAGELAQKCVAAMPLLDAGWVALGMSRHGQNDLPGAIEAYRKARELNRGNFEAALNLAIVLKLSGKLAEALPLAREATASAAFADRAWYEVGNCLQVLGNAADALQAYLKAVAARADYGDAWINCAGCANRLGQPEKAREYALNATRYSPDHVLSWVQLCQSEINLGNREAAAAAVEKARACTWTRPEERADVAAMLHDLGRLDECLAVAEEVTKAHPAFARGWLLAGSAQKKLGRLREALAAFGNQAKADPQNPDPLAEGAQIHYDLGEYEQAITAAKLALARDAGCFDAHNVIGHARMELQQYVLAIESYEAALRAIPTAAWPWFNIGVAHIKLNQLAQAARALEQCVANDPANATGWEYLGICRKSLGELETALEAYGKALAANPRQAGAALGACEAANGLSRWEEAERWGKVAVELAPADGRGWYQYGRCLLALEKFAESEVALDKTAVAFPGVASVYYLRCEARLGQKKYEGAKADGEEAFRLDPRFGDALVGVARAQVGLGQGQEAIATLRRAFDAGADRAWALKQPDFDALRDTDEWKKLLADFPVE